MKTIKTFTHDTNGQSARVLKNEDGEYVVRFFAGAAYLQDSDYFTDDKHDAFDTAKLQIATLWNKVEEDKSVTVSTTVILEDDFIDDVLVVATEGGSNYWGDFAGERTLLTVTDTDGDEDYEHLLNFAKVRAAIRKLVNPAEDVNVNERTRRAIREAVVHQDAGMIDAELADVIVQIACFDELVYG